MARSAATNVKVGDLAAADIGGTSDTLRQEVDAFLAVMARQDQAERRMYQRIAGNGLRTSFRAPDGANVEATVRDISRGGIALLTDWECAPGIDLSLTLGNGDTVLARGVRSGGGLLALAFHQDAATLRLVDKVLARIGGADAAGTPCAGTRRGGSEAA